MNVITEKPPIMEEKIIRLRDLTPGTVFKFGSGSNYYIRTNSNNPNAISVQGDVYNWEPSAIVIPLEATLTVKEKYGRT